MTPPERARAAGHPSTFRFSDAHLRRELSDADGSAAAGPSALAGEGVGASVSHASPATPWSVCASTASSIESLTVLWRRLRAGRHE